MAYAVGTRFFYRAEFVVDERVLIPRVESELIVELVRDKCRKHQRTLVDVGTGSGCLGLSCALEFPWLTHLILTDLSATALAVAALNRERLAPKCQVELRHLCCRKEVPVADIVVANPPYVKCSQKNKVHPQVYRYEPHQALFLADEDYELWYRDFFSRLGESIRIRGLFVMEGEEEHLPRLSTLFIEYAQSRLEIQDWGLEQDLTGSVRFLWAQFGGLSG